MGQSAGASGRFLYKTFMAPRRSAVALVLAAALAAWPHAAGAQFWPFSPPRREVRVGVAGLPAVVDPATALEGAPALVARQVFDTLVAWKEGSTDIEPALATRWSVSRDALTWTFTLRDNVRFHDGTALSAAEVVASFDRHLRDPQRPPVAWAALFRGAPGVIKQVRAVDARTVEFVLVQPYAPLLTVLAHPGFGIAREVAGSGGTRLAGTGPFRVAEVSASRVVLEAVAGHWAGAPQTDRLIFLEVSGDDHAEAELDARGLHLWFPDGPPRRQQGALAIPGLRMGYLAFQTEKEPFARKKIRQAIAGALDPAVLGVALGRTAVPLQSFLPAGMWGRREGSPILGGTRRAVAGLLAEGGWPAGYTPTLLAPRELPFLDMPGLAETLRLMLQAADIPIVTQLEPEGTFRAAREAGEHDLVLAETTVTSGDPHHVLYPLSTSEGASREPEVRNFSFYRNPRLDDVLVRASQISWRPERRRLYQRAQAILAEEVPWIPLYVRLVWAVARPEVRGLRLHPTGYPRLTGISVDGAGQAPAPSSPQYSYPAQP